ncbi:putative Na/H antiporter [Aspergillus neoniger CBS 115656]|uniref:Na/H antiporter n=1 Tax=Aspergillus neoniger (strain CBS 115656) TaxID=1448310 RepID=A0A318YFL5_ASPNB|nr:Na/H antiporter [Aspergillus neoniger CBS 115656]PYH33251.1 Na/H antiporter [Aspergillus neoniger CBS 115656]
MPTLSLINFNIVCATLGGFISVFGLVSYLFKERFYLSEALISLLAGVIFSPHAANFIRPQEYALGSEQNLEEITLYFTRLVLGVQLVLAGVQLPKRYLQIEWKSLSLLLGPGMAAMWMCSSLVIWAMVPNFPFLHALVVGACITPTDPVLSNSIVKGKFADKNVPRPLQRIIVAESGANDGLGYPFLYFGLYLLKYIGMGGEGYSGGAGKAIGLWFYETWVYTVILSVVYGIVVGWLSRKLLHWAEEKHYVDRESFLVFAIALSLFIIGTCGLIGTDDLLACFVAGNVFTQDDWFRLETMDDSLQPTIDMLLNLAVFMWFGAVCPWSSFLNNSVIPIYRLIFLGILILLVRRMPIIFAMHKLIHQIEHFYQAAFVGFFGPIGVGAVFYLSVSREFLNQITVDGQVREDAAKVSEAVNVVVWFLVICSIIVHGLCIPLAKAGYHLPRTISQALSTSTIAEPDPVPIANVQHTHSTATRGVGPTNNRNRKRGHAGREPPDPAVFQIGRSVIRTTSSQEQVQVGAATADEPARPVNLIVRENEQDSPQESSNSNSPTPAVEQHV